MKEYEITTYVEQCGFKRINPKRNDVKVYQRDDLGKDLFLLVSNGKVGFQFNKEHNNILEDYEISFGAVPNFLEGLPFFLVSFHNHPFVTTEFEDKASDSFSGGIVGWLALNGFFLRSPFKDSTVFPSFYKKHACDSVFLTTRKHRDEMDEFKLVFDSRDMQSPKFVEVSHERKNYFSGFANILVTEHVTCVVPYSTKWKNREIFHWAWTTYSLEHEDFLSKFQKVSF